MPETELPESFLTEFTGSTGAFSQGSREIFWGNRSSGRGRSSVFESNIQEIAMWQKEKRHLFHNSRFDQSFNG